MSFVYSYSNTDITSGNIDIEKMQEEVIDSAILDICVGISSLGSNFEISFDTELDAGDVTILDDIVEAHNGNPLNTYKVIIQNAMDFFNELLINFAAENITLGITFYGKTKEVSDLLENVQRYGQGGSLYEVRAEIIALEALGWPTSTIAFVNDARMQILLNKVETYLGIDPLTDWS